MTETEDPSPQESEEPRRVVVGPDIADLSTSSLLSEVQTEVSLSDPLFPFSQSFCAKTHKEREMAFMKAFEDQVSFIRTKELRAESAVGKQPYKSETLESIAKNRDKFFEQAAAKETKKALLQKETVSSTDPAPRIEVETMPSFDPLLNITYESQYALMDSFKEAISTILLQNRAKTRARKVMQKLMAAQGQTIGSSAHSSSAENAKFTAESLLAIDIKCTSPGLKFAKPAENQPPEAPEIDLQPNVIEKNVEQYKPGLVERFRLAAFPRTETDSFTPISIIPPAVFPTVPEEQPVREVKEPLLPEDSVVNPLTKTDISSVNPLPNSYAYPRDVRFFKFDPTYSLRAIPKELDPLPNQIGQASILAMPLTDYEDMFIGSKCSAAVSPFTFTGISKARLPMMSGPDPIDMRELEADDDIDNLEIHPKSRPVSDYITKPLDTTNKSHEIAEQVIKSQEEWNARQKEGAKKLSEKLLGINKLMNDKGLEIPTSDLQLFIQD